MQSKDQHFHGSDIERIEQNYGISKNELINFSSNINPLGLSEHLKEKLREKIELIATYPDRDYLSLRSTIAQYTQVNLEHILVGNGSTELISLLIKVIQPKNAVIIGPTYSEYEREIFIAGGSSRYYPLHEENDFQVNIEELKATLHYDTDLLVICNPNNPTSTAIKNEALREILDHCKSFDIFVMIDETYVEFVDEPNVSAAQLAEFYNNLFIIRGVSKFFAAPGLRLGYGICGNLDYITKMNRLKNPWTINSLAAFAGEVMLLDEDYIEESRRLIYKERQKIIKELSTIPNLKFYYPEANFILVKILDETLTASYLFKKLLANKILIRDATDFPFLGSKYFRFCILSPEENNLLLTRLKEIL